MNEYEKGEKIGKIFKIVCIILAILGILCAIILNVIKIFKDNKITTVYYGESAKFSNGVEIKATDCVQKQSIKVNDWTTYETDGVFLLVEITVTNNGKKTYTATDDNIYLTYDDGKIEQHKSLKYEFGNIFRRVSVGATLSKTYWAVFEIAKGVDINDLTVVITREKSWLVTEKIGLRLKRKPS